MLGTEQGQEDGVYHVLGQEDGVYNVLGQEEKGDDGAPTYEVPDMKIVGRRQDKAHGNTTTVGLEMEYSTLQSAGLEMTYSTLQYN